MIVSDLRGSLSPKFYDTALSASAHACTAAASMDWSHLTIHLHASAGLYNLRWVSRGADRVGSSSSDPATVLILPPSSTSDSLVALPPLLLHLSHALNFTACAAPPFKILTSSHARVCISHGEEVQEGEEEAEQLCSSEDEVTLRCSASPTAGGALRWRFFLDHVLFDGDGHDFRNSRHLNQHFPGDAYPPDSAASVGRASGLWCEIRAVMSVGAEAAFALRAGRVLMWAIVDVEAEGAGVKEIKSDTFWATAA
jgi:hypothetical protein